MFVNFITAIIEMLILNAEDGLTVSNYDTTNRCNY